MSFNINLGTLKKDLKDFSQRVAKSMAQQTREKLMQAAPFCTAAYYTDYRPDYYNRKYYNFMDNSYKPFYKNPHNTIYRGGIVLSSDFMDDIYKMPTEYVFDMFYDGIHGHGTRDGGFVIDHVTNPSPLKLLLNERERIINEDIDEMREKAIATANREGSFNFNFK